MTKNEKLKIIHTLLDSLKQEVKKTLSQNNGRLTQEQIYLLCFYRRELTSIASLP